MATRELVRDGVRISYRTEGNGGPTVLLLPAFQHVAQSDAGHCPHLSYPAMVNGVLLDLLASVTGGRNAA